MPVNRFHSAKSDIGRKRPHNEDCFLADTALGLYVVCDGMGGGNAGEVASRMAIDTILAHVQAPAQSMADDTEREDPHLTQATNQLVRAIRSANAAVLQASWEDPKYAGMGTTVAAIRLSGTLLSIAHVGDSRVYLIRNGTIQALTLDHSWVAEQVAQGHMTEEEAQRSPRRNITGSSVMAPDLSGKQLELLKEIVPRLSHVAVFGTSAQPGNVSMSAMFGYGPRVPPSAGYSSAVDFVRSSANRRFMASISTT